jgi:ABC-type multidrug transport system ATPase subunit
MLEIRDLVKVYPGPVTALQGINLEVPEGMFGLLGPNGAGKTTLMRILAGLLEATSGSVLLDGEDILPDPNRVWSRLGYLPQEFGFYPHLTGEKMLAHLLRLKGVSASGRSLKQLCAELLERVNLSFAADKKVKTYSGGMRQRLGIAQAVAGNPRLIIVDEPTAGLDPEERQRFYHLLAELAADRLVLLSTHIVEDVAVLCPRFAMIRQGKLVISTSPSQALDKVRGRIFEASIQPEEVPELRKRAWVTQNILVAGRSRVRIFDPSGVPPAGFEAVASSLEDAYFVLMQEGGGSSSSAPSSALSSTPGSAPTDSAQVTVPGPGGSP